MSAAKTPGTPAQRITNHPRARARLTTCPTCRTWVLTGLDNEWGAVMACADPTPITWLGEQAAIAWGRQTYVLERRRLRHRETWQTRHIPETPLFAEHKCGEPIHPAWKAPPPPPKNNPEYPPF